MGMQIKQPEWEKVEYARKRIERAGKCRTKETIGRTMCLSGSLLSQG